MIVFLLCPRWISGILTELSLTLVAVGWVSLSLSRILSLSLAVVPHDSVSVSFRPPFPCLSLPHHLMVVSVACPGNGVCLFLSPSLVFFHSLSHCQSLSHSLSPLSLSHTHKHSHSLSFCLSFCLLLSFFLIFSLALLLSL